MDHSEYINQEKLHNSIVDLTDHVNNLSNMFQNNFSLMIERGDLTQEKLTQSIDTTKLVFDNLVNEVESLKTRAIDIMEYKASTAPKKIELDAVAELKQAEIEAEKHSKIVSDKREQLLSVCTHNDTREESAYHEGHHFDESYTIDYIKCNSCNKTLSEKTSE